MARPTKHTSALSNYSQTKDEIKARSDMEEKLKGEGLPTAPDWLTESQKNIFNTIIELLKESGMLCVNDLWILEKAAIAIDRIENIERKINSWGDAIVDKDALAVIRVYTSDFYRACNELCLSPQARAKLANAVIDKGKKKPLESVVAKASEI